MRNGRFTTGPASVNKSALSASKNIVISPLESLHINITNLTAFVDHIDKHLHTYDKVNDEVRKDFIKALRNVVSFASIIPEILTADMSSLISDPKKMLDIGSIQAANIWEDVRIIYYFCLTSLDEIGKNNQADKVLLVMPLIRFIFTKEGDPESMERIAKRFVEHAPLFLNHSRDQLIKAGKYQGDKDNPYTSSITQSGDSRSDTTTRRGINDMLNDEEID